MIVMGKFRVFGLIVIKSYRPIRENDILIIFNLPFMVVNQLNTKLNGFVCLSILVRNLVQSNLSRLSFFVDIPITGKHHIDNCC